MEPSALGQRLIALRTAAGVSSRELSKLAGLSHGALWHLEQGSVTDTKSAVVDRLAEVLDVSLEFLIRGDGPEPEPESLRAAVERARAAAAEPKAVA